MNVSWPASESTTYGTYEDSTVSWPDSNTTASGSDEASTEAYLWICVSPLLFCIGIIGNSLSLVAFRRMGFGRSPANVYLSCIATADSFVLLLGLLPQWLKQSGFVALHELSPMSCKISYFCTFVSGDTAIWLLALFTIDRAAAVRFPLRNFRATRTRSVFALCVSALGFACAKNVHLFWTRGAVFDADTGALISNCAKMPGYEQFESFVRPWIAFSLISVAPFLIVLVNNSVIVHVLVGYHDRLRMNIIMANAEHNFRQTIFMCLAVSVAFFVCVTPNFALLIGRPYWKAAVSDRSALNVTDAVNNLLLYTNHSINFFLYCMTGKVFRKELLNMFSGHCYRHDSPPEVDSHRGLGHRGRMPLSLIVAAVLVDSPAGSSNNENGNKEIARHEQDHELDLMQTTKL